MSKRSSFASFNYYRAFLAFLAIVCYSNSGNVLVSGGYPYSSDDLSARQAQILDKLRGDMTLMMNEDIVPNELKEPSFGEMFLRNLEVYKCVRNFEALILNQLSLIMLKATAVPFIGRIVLCYSVPEAQGSPLCWERTSRTDGSFAAVLHDEGSLLCAAWQLLERGVVSQVELSYSVNAMQPLVQCHSSSHSDHRTARCYSPPFYQMLLLSPVRKIICECILTCVLTCLLTCVLTWHMFCTASTVAFAVL